LSKSALASSLANTIHEITRKVTKKIRDFRVCSCDFVDRSDNYLTMRMGMRRFTRLTNGFSNKIEIHMHAIAIH
jgi:hypothetical protein